MIKERYVNFEVANLLRDKGFNLPSFSHYRLDNEELCHFSTNCNTNLKFNNYITAPTQQTACDWIEETYNISIEVWVGIIGYRIEILYALKDPNIASSNIIHDFNDNALCGDNSDGSWSNKELAYNEAIKYVLTNLV